MGKTRNRVTLLVLGLEGLGFLLLAFAFWLAGDTRLTCETAEAKGRLLCVLEERRLAYMLTVRQVQLTEVRGAHPDAEDGAWLVLETGGGQERTLHGGFPTTEADSFQLESLRQNGGQPISLVRSDLGWALLTAIFGFLWLIVISLIMREFLGFHTPWWASFFRRT